MPSTGTPVSKVRPSIRHLAILVFLVLIASPALAQLTDNTQTPHTANSGIAKSLSGQVGAGHGTVNTPGSAVFIIERDPFRSVRRGRQLFQRKFTVAQGNGPRTGDGVGNIEADGSIGAGLSDSCASCHGRPRGSAGFGGDVFTRPDSRDAPHLFGLGLQEMLGDEITADLRAIRDAASSQAQMSGVPVNASLDSKGINYGSITALPNGMFDTSGVEGVNADLRVRPFFAEGTTISIREFSVGAFNAEMGLEAYDPIVASAAAGNLEETPAGMVLDGTIDAIEGSPASGVNDDPDGDGVTNEIDMALIDHMEFYLLNYFKPGTYQQTARTTQGRRHFERFGCTSCHIPDLVIDEDRRVADVETTYDPVNGIFNNLFASATPLFTETDDQSGHPTLKSPARGSFVVKNFFADLKRHDLGPNFWERNFDGSLQKEFITEPLWGVGSTAPYGHDGRSINLQEVILRHGGEAQASRDAFAAAPEAQQRRVTDFLQTLVLFPPDDTASNLNPGVPGGDPQSQHGNIALGVLFNDPSEGE